MDRRRLLRTSALALTAGLAGCGGEGGDDTPTEADTDTPSPSPSPTGGDTVAGTTRAPGTPSPAETPTPAATTTAPAESATPTGTPTATPEPVAQVVAVGPDDDQFAFVPDSFEIATGETVRWVWRSPGHNVRTETTPDGSDWNGTPGGGSETYAAGYTHAQTFTTAGDYAYFCRPHRGLDMEGSFTVTE